MSYKRNKCFVQGDCCMCLLHCTLAIRSLNVPRYNTTNALARMYLCEILPCQNMLSDKDGYSSDLSLQFLMICFLMQDWGDLLLLGAVELPERLSLLAKFLVKCSNFCTIFKMIAHPTSGVRGPRNWGWIHGTWWCIQDKTREDNLLSYYMSTESLSVTTHTKIPCMSMTVRAKNATWLEKIEHFNLRKT